MCVFSVTVPTLASHAFSESLYKSHAELKDVPDCLSFS